MEEEEERGKEEVMREGAYLEDATSPPAPGASANDEGGGRGGDGGWGR